MRPLRSDSGEPPLGEASRYEPRYFEHGEMHLRELRALLDAPGRVAVVRFRYTYQHLLDLTHSIVAILGSGEGLSNSGPDTKANKVYVEVLPERIDEVRRASCRRPIRTTSMSNPGLPFERRSRQCSSLCP